MRRSLLAILASTSMAFPVLAADLPSQSEAPYYAPPPVFTWTGAYVGANAAFGFGRFTGGGNSYFGGADGGLYGITAGYNYQSGPLVAGIEGDLDFGGVSGTGYPGAGISGTGNLNGEGSLRARFGYAFNHTLVYITGGYTGANLNGSVYRPFRDAQPLCQPVDLSEWLRDRRRRRIRADAEYLGQGGISLQRLRKQRTVQRHARQHQLRPASSRRCAPGSIIISRA